MPDPEFYNRWSIDPATVPTTGPVGETRSVTPKDFETKWGLNVEAPKKQGVVDALIGRNGPRYQLWPERLVRGVVGDAISFATLFGDVAEGKVDPEGEEAFNRLMPGAMMLTPALRVGAGNKLMATGTRPLTSVSPETAVLAKTARETYGIPIRGGQMAESKAAKYADSVLQNSPFSGYGGNVRAQQSAFNRAIAKTIGEDSDVITAEVMASAKKRLGNKFDEIAERTPVIMDDALKNQFRSIFDEAATVLPEQEVRPILNQLLSIASKADERGVVSGQSFQALTRKGAPLNRAKNSADPNIRFYAGKIEDALRDALERSARPRDVRELRETRRQWASMKTIEDLAEKAPTGDISSALLLGQVRKTYDNFAYGGGGELGDLARIGQRFMKEPPNSGTADRLWWMQMLGLGGAGGGLGTMAFYDPVMALKAGAATVAGAGTNRLLGQYMKSDRYANKLIENTLRGTNQATPSIMRQAIPFVPAGYLEHRPSP